MWDLSGPGVGSMSPCTGRLILYHRATWEALYLSTGFYILRSCLGPICTETSTRKKEALFIQAPFLWMTGLSGIMSKVPGLCIELKVNFESYFSRMLRWISSCLSFDWATNVMGIKHQNEYKTETYMSKIFLKVQSYKRGIRTVFAHPCS